MILDRNDICIDCDFAPFFQIKNGTGLMKYYLRTYCSEKESMDGNMFFCADYDNGRCFPMPKVKRQRIAIVNSIVGRGHFNNINLVSLRISFYSTSEHMVYVSADNVFNDMCSLIRSLSHKLGFAIYLAAGHSHQFKNEINNEYCPHIHLLLAPIVNFTDDRKYVDNLNALIDKLREKNINVRIVYDD